MKVTRSLILLMIVFFCINLNAQVVLSNNNSSGDESAILDIQSDDKGVLIPQIALTGLDDAVSINSPATSLLIYNTSSVNQLTPGYYYNAGTNNEPAWVRLANGMNDGSETKINGGSNITVSGTGTENDPYIIDATAHYIGENYGGGIVFYTYDGGQHGLIAATSDQSAAIAWHNGIYTITCARRSGIRGGKLNTESIIINQGAGSYAASICDNYEGGNFHDWHLPSQYELQLLYAQKDIIGSFHNDWYWSSTEVFNPDYAWVRHFGNGSSDDHYKAYTRRVRAIRSF